MNLKLKKINQCFKLNYKYPTAYDLISLVLLVFIIAHYCGCGFHLISVYSKIKVPTIKTWIETFKLVDENWEIRYLNSLYFSIITMVTVGYGDIAPINIYEKIYMICMVVISCGVFAYCVNCIGNIFTTINLK